MQPPFGDWLCALCFDAVISALDSSYVNKVTEEYNEVHDEAYAVFVTWKKMSDSQQNITTLRGCIGTFSPVRIPEGIIVFAKKSGFEDSRFPPISLHEVPCLKVAVSLLEKFEECPNGVEDWTLGIHGIRIIYAEKYTATFLPEVAIEQNWTKQNTINAALKKAGWTLPSYEKEKLSIYRYKTKKFLMGYEEYCQVK